MREPEPSADDVAEIELRRRLIAGEKARRGTGPTCKHCGGELPERARGYGRASKCPGCGRRAD